MKTTETSDSLVNQYIGRKAYTTFLFYTVVCFKEALLDHKRNILLIATCRKRFSSTGTVKISTSSATDTIPG